jgi:hypothetical protein
MVPRSPAPGDSVHPVIFCVEEESMEDVTELISKVSQELGPDASDEQITEKTLEVIKALPESEREQLLEQLVKGTSSGRLRHLDKEADSGRQAEGDKSSPNSESAS